MPTKNRPPPSDAETVSPDELQADLDKLGARRGGGWVRQPVEVWAGVWPQLARPWTDDQVLFDLRWQQDQYGKVLSRTQLGRRYGWTRDEVRTPLRRVADWWDPKWGDPPVARETPTQGLTQPDPPKPNVAQTDPAETGEPEQLEQSDPTVPSLTQADPAVPQRVGSQAEAPPQAQRSEGGGNVPPPPPPPGSHQRDLFGPRQAVRQPERRSKPKKPPTPFVLAGRIANAWKAAHADRFTDTYPLVWAGPGMRRTSADEGASLLALVDAFGLLEDPDRGLLRFKSAAAVYFEAVQKGIAYPEGKPASLHFFLKDLARWTGYGDQRLKPRVVGTPAPEVKADPPEPEVSDAELIDRALKEWKERGSK